MIEWVCVEVKRAQTAYLQMIGPAGMTVISVVVPCYNEEEALSIFHSEIFDAIHTMRDKDPGLFFELIFVDDGSTDETLPIVKSLQENTPPDAAKVIYLSFSRNFGKEAALYAGLKQATGDFVATMDADLQDPPSLLPRMYEELASGDVDNIATKRLTCAGEPAVRSLFARPFYRLINALADIDIVDGSRDYRLMSRQMVDAILLVTEYNRFSKASSLG